MLHIRSGSFLTWPCQSDVLMRMMLSGSWLSDTRMWLSWSYTVFLGICDTRGDKNAFPSAADGALELFLYFLHPANKGGQPAAFLLQPAGGSVCPGSARCPGCWPSRSVACWAGAPSATCCGLAFLPTWVPACVGRNPKEEEEKTGRGNGAKGEEEEDGIEMHTTSDGAAKTLEFFQYLLDEMMRDSVLVILPLGGNLSRNVSMLSISSSVVGVTASGCSCKGDRKCLN